MTAAESLLTEKHKQFLLRHTETEQKTRFFSSDSHLAVSGYYWVSKRVHFLDRFISDVLIAVHVKGITTMSLLSAKDKVPRNEVLEFLGGCWDAESGSWNELHYSC